MSCSSVVLGDERLSKTGQNGREGGAVEEHQLEVGLEGGQLEDSRLAHGG